MMVVASVTAALAFGSFSVFIGRWLCLLAVIRPLEVSVGHVAFGLRASAASSEPVEREVHAAISQPSGSVRMLSGQVISP